MSARRISAGPLRERRGGYQPPGRFSWVASWAMRPPFSFWSCQKENGPRPVQEKKTLARNLRLKRKFAYVREISESVLTKPWQTSSGSRRTWAFAPLCLRVCQSGGNFGAVIERSAFLNPPALCLAVDGSLARQADIGIRPYGNTL